MSSRFSGWTEKDLAKLNIVSDGGTLNQVIAEPKKNKFGAEKMETGGDIYDSRMEGGYSQKLDLQVMAGEMEGYDRQVVIPLMVAGVLICNYKIDFVERYFGGRKVYTEVKGMPTASWKLKWKLFCALYPELEKKIVYKNKTV